MGFLKKPEKPKKATPAELADQLRQQRAINFGTWLIDRGVEHNPNVDSDKDYICDSDEYTMEGLYKFYIIEMTQ